MKPTDFTVNTPGRLVHIALPPSGILDDSGSQEPYWAFVPAPLPPDIQLDNDTIVQLSQAALALGELRGVGQMLPNPHLLINPFMRREAVLSSRIEGTIAGLQQLLLFEEEPTETMEKSDVREVANYVQALEYGLRRLEQLPVSLRLMRELHEHLMEGVRGHEQRPGEFRRIQNFIGKRGQTVHNARFVPPPAMEIDDAMNRLERFIGATDTMPFLVKLALIHYQFEAIHPFMDGNGRIGRLLITLLLCERKILPSPLLYLSAYFERHRDDYVGHLLNVSRRGAWLEWIRYFLQGIAEQSRDANVRSRRLLALQNRYREQLHATGTTNLQLLVADQLFVNPVTTMPRVRGTFKVTSRSAQLAINKLEEAGILREISGRQRNRVYIALEIIALIEEEQSKSQIDAYRTNQITL